MSLKYSMISLFLFSFLLHSLVDASPHPDPQGGNRHRHRPGAGAVSPSTTTRIQGGGGGGGGNAVNTVTQNANSDPTTVPNPGNGSPSTGTGNGKRGLAYNSTSPSLDVFSNTAITWSHDWNSLPLDAASSSFEFVPTLWGDQSPHSDNWAQNAAGHEYLMSFNEPDIISQADMPVDDAVTAYKKLMFPLRSNTVKIGAPSVSSGSGTNEHGVPMGTGWLRQFLNQCNDPDTCVA